MLIFWHNPRCSKSREALALLHDRGYAPHIVDYLHTPPDHETLRAAIAKLGFRSARQLLRPSEEAWALLGLQETTLSENALIQAMVAHPVLIERPLLINGDRARLGRPPARVLEIV